MSHVLLPGGYNAGGWRGVWRDGDKPADDIHVQSQIDCMAMYDRCDERNGSDVMQLDCTDWRVMMCRICHATAVAFEANIVDRSLECSFIARRSCIALCASFLPPSIH